MLRGVSTVRLHTSDLAAAKQWYTELLGVAPYYERPEYIEFRIGDYQQELGLLDRKYAPAHDGAPSGVVVYWHVDDVAAALERLLALGAQLHEPLRDFGGGGFIGASVIDPFGNVLGIMINPHYQEVLGTITLPA